MNKDYIKPNSWSIIEEGFNRENVEASESIFSLGNEMISEISNNNRIIRSSSPDVGDAFLP